MVEGQDSNKEVELVEDILKSSEGKQQNLQVIICIFIAVNTPCFINKGTALFSTITVGFLVDFYSFCFIGNWNKCSIMT